MPLRQLSKYKGPAPRLPNDKTDIIDETINYFRLYSWGDGNLSILFTKIIYLLSVLCQLFLSDVNFNNTF